MGLGGAGVDRFKIVQILEEKPVLLCEVEILDVEDEDHPQVRFLV